jgi:hypothetical protein
MCLAFALSGYISGKDSIAISAASSIDIISLSSKIADIEYPF